jgi:hypothetical protein
MTNRNQDETTTGSGLSYRWKRVFACFFYRSFGSGDDHNGPLYPLLGELIMQDYAEERFVDMDATVVADVTEFAKSAHKKTNA